MTPGDHVTTTLSGKLTTHKVVLVEHDWHGIGRIGITVTPQVPMTAHGSWHDADDFKAAS